MRDGAYRVQIKGDVVMVKTVLRAACVTTVAMTVGLAGCARQKATPPPPTPPPTVSQTKDYWRPLPANAPALRKVADAALVPDLRPALEGDRPELLKSLDQSLRYLKTKLSEKHFPKEGIEHARALRSVEEFRALLAGKYSVEELQRQIFAKFDVYESVGCDDQGTVLFTGYYTPIFDARLTANETFKYPLYKLPPDLVKGPNGDCLGRKMGDGSMAPYFTRAEIEAGALHGQEIAFLKDRFEAYVCTIQGSAHLRLPGGGLFRVGYAGNNGRAYTSVGQQLVKDGLITQGQLSLSGLTEYFRSNPEKMDLYLARNERYVFFTKTDSLPTGSLGVPVTPRHSVATDKAIFPRGGVALVDTIVPKAGPKGPESAQFRQFVLDQDTGGAIRAPGRCDIYLGIGDEAGKIAGWTLSEGRLYYFFLK
jgi:membrane-bound lytic murein transglycosylase A